VEKEWMFDVSEKTNAKEKPPFKRISTDMMPLVVKGEKKIANGKNDRVTDDELAR
jgi:hypothetical protein